MADKTVYDMMVDGGRIRVAAASTANIADLAAPGATMDGVTLAAGDYVLLKDQTTTSENGVYVWNGAATLMYRAPESNTASKLNHQVVVVNAGTVAEGNEYRQSSIVATLDTDAVSYVAEIIP